MDQMDQYRGKKVLIVGLGRTGFSLIHIFNHFDCEIRVTDIRPIFDLNKQVKRLKKINPTPQMTLGEHREEDFMEADVVIYSSAVNPNLPQIQMAREAGKEVESEFSFAYKHCNKPLVAVCGTYGRTSIAHMIGFTLKLDQKNVFVGGTSDNPFSNFVVYPNKDELDYVIVEVSPTQMQSVPNFKPFITIFPNLEENFKEGRFQNASEYMESALSVLNNIDESCFLIANFDKLSGNSIIRNSRSETYWYSRKSFVNMGVITEVNGTHFHGRRIHNNIHYHSEYSVQKMRVVGQNNRENMLAAITVCSVLKSSNDAIQNMIQRFPGIPHSLEFIIEKNGVRFYNDSKSETMEQLAKSIQSFKQNVILIAGGKDNDQNYEKYYDLFKNFVRVCVLVGESKETMNRDLGSSTQTFLVGSFDESVLIAYQKSRTGDVIVLCPGCDGTDTFRDYQEKGNYFKKLIFQL
jgi:UDP-N-acetylmuramoylalanine--D-glutamate ligase